MRGSTSAFRRASRSKARRAMTWCPAGPAAITSGDRRFVTAELREVGQRIGPLPENWKPDQRAVQAISGKFESAFSQDVAGAAEASMNGYVEALEAGGQRAIGIVQSMVQEMKAMLTFTAGPTIQPTFAPAGGGAAAAPAVAPTGSKAAAVGSTVTVTQNITTANSRLAARRAQREQNRATRLAQSRALHDGVGLA